MTTATFGPDVEPLQLGDFGPIERTKTNAPECVLVVDGEQK